MADGDEVLGPDAISSAEEISEAKQLGWADGPDWRGDKTGWVDAKTFLEKGRPVLGVMKENNQRLTRELHQANSRLASLEGSIRAAEAVIETLQESHAADVEEQVKAARTELTAEIERASRDGDHAGLAAATGKLIELNQADKDAGGTGDDKGKDKGDKGDKGQPKAMHPEVAAWVQANPDFVNNPKKMALSGVIATEVRSDPQYAGLVGRAFMDLVAAKVDETLGLKRGNGTTRVGSGNGGSNRTDTDGGSKGKSYADLPAEAKAACEKQAPKLVGPNRAHKTIEAWRGSYARQYFQER